LEGVSESRDNLFKAWFRINKQPSWCSNWPNKLIATIDWLVNQKNQPIEFDLISLDD